MGSFPSASRQPEAALLADGALGQGVIIRHRNDLHQFGPQTLERAAAGGVVGGAGDPQCAQAMPPASGRMSRQARSA